MNPPDWKHSMNPKPKPNLYHGERGFTAGTGEPGNGKPLVALVLSIPPCLPSSTFSTRSRKTRSLWSSMIPPCGTTRLEKPGSGHPDYQVEPDGSGVSRLCPPRKQDSGPRWSHRRTRPPWFWLLPPTRFWLASVSNEFNRLRLGAVTMLLRRLRCWSASQPATLELLAPATSRKRNL